MTGADLDLFSNLKPEDLKQLLGLGTLDEQGQLLQQQMAQAQALRRPSGTQYTAPVAAGLGGLADVLNSVNGTIQTHQARSGQEALLKQKDEGRGLYAKAIAEALRGRLAPPAGAAGVSLPTGPQASAVRPGANGGIAALLPFLHR